MQKRKIIAVSIYLKPRLSEEDKLSKDLNRLQVLQNDIIRLITENRREQHVNMKELRKEMKIMSVNKMVAYHVLIETFNVLNFGSVGKIKQKITKTQSAASER